MNIIKKFEIDVTPKEMAKVFADWNDYDQALFFTELYNCVKKWDKDFSFQAQFISECKELSPGAREIMKIIGEYSYI